MDYKEYQTKALERVKDNSNSAMVSDIKETIYEWFNNPIEQDLITGIWSIIDEGLLFDKSILSTTRSKHWRFSSMEIQALLRKRGLQVPNAQWLKKCMEEEMGLKSEVKYCKASGKNKRGWLVTEEFIQNIIN